MNLSNLANPARWWVFRAWRSLQVLLPGRQIQAFGDGVDQIGSIVVINLDRQPRRWRQVTKELRRFRTSDGTSLIAITRRFSAVDARDGRAAAATGDVDAIYRIGDQLYVQPDARLAACFPNDEPVRMTRQEVAVARSHIEVWKAVARGETEYVLVLEDDVWFKTGSASAIDRGWRAARKLATAEGEPKLLYLSYSDADGTLLRQEIDENLFRPIRGLWFLSGYVLSRSGAASLLRAMPVVGPVDLWMNYRFDDLAAVALHSPVVMQRRDGTSDNAYSVLPYLARAGIVDVDCGLVAPKTPRVEPVLAWTRAEGQESLAMALSMLGLRVRAFDRDDEPMSESQLRRVLATFDALVDPPIAPAVAAAAADNFSCLIVLEYGAQVPSGLDFGRLPEGRSAVLPRGGSWDSLCDLLRIDKPVDPFPTGVTPESRLFRDARSTNPAAPPAPMRLQGSVFDDSPWVLPAAAAWRPATGADLTQRSVGPTTIAASMTSPSTAFSRLVETFPGNLAAFDHNGVRYGDSGAQLVLEVQDGQYRPYRSGAFASVRSFRYGRFEAEIRAAAGPGLVTGFFVHRSGPRQEIDIEFSGVDPRRMLTNVFFNPGDDGTALSFGYRGTPHWIDLDFDATAKSHHYAIEWWPHRITWMVDNRIVHERSSWDPTPIPHLPMRLHANLWAPRSSELAGSVDPLALPATAKFRNVAITNVRDHDAAGGSPVAPP